ncbi:MAG: hypothetical protein Q8Q15_04355 [bacterium]|nr:hypothetical protein [bacterium]
MSARFLLHSAFLVLSIVLTFAWTKNPTLSLYTLQATAVLVLVYFANQFFGRHRGFGLAIDGLIFTTITLLLVSQTGGLASPLFFLFYLLLFGLALFFEPIPTLVFSIMLVAFFAGQAKNLEGIVQLASLVIITPLALFFGKQYVQLLEKEKEIKLLEQKKKSLSREVEMQEEDTLLWLSLSFSERVTEILDNSSNLLAGISKLTTTQKEGLQKIHESAKRLLKLGDKLKEKIKG